jgi:predicted NodU family carbamoyl transferase
MGKPILHTTEDALLMFYTTGLDAWWSRTGFW